MAAICKVEECSNPANIRKLAKEFAHIKSWSDYPDLRLDINNVRILCMNCHYRETYDRELESGKLWGHTNMIGVL